MKIRWAVLELLYEDKLTETKLEINYFFFCKFWLQMRSKCFHSKCFFFVSCC